MAGMRVSMRKIREVLRLTHELGLSVRQVREATGVGKTAVCEYVARAKVIGITWPIPPEISDAELEQRLFTPAGFHDGPTRTAPDWCKVHEELKRRGVTLMILWEEHRGECTDGHGYSRFCELYSEWRKRLSPIMRQTHVAGDKLFVDWAGDTVPIIDPMTGEVHAAHLFVAALGASSYTYAEARWTETLPDWIGAHVNALDFLGGVPKATVPDNLKVGITKPSRYEPGINRTYQDLADHYGFVVLPARVRKPRDKAMASYCTLFRCRRADGDHACPAGTTSAAAFDDDLTLRDLPESTVEAVCIAFADEALASPLVHRGLADMEPFGHLARGEHAAAA